MAIKNLSGLDLPVISSVLKTDANGVIVSAVAGTDYLSSINSSMVTTALGYTPVPTTRTITINGTAFDLSANRSWTISTITGNAGSATVLQTARTLTIGNTGKSFNGSANVSWSLAEVGALPLTGGNLTGTTSLTGGVSLMFNGAADTNWRIGRNIITETGNQLTANTMQFVAANAANEGWQFIDDDGNTRFEIGASTGNAWLPSGNLYLAGNLAATQAYVTSQGYTSNTGTVTSVSGAGGYGGLTLSGTVTTSGSLTLGGTPTGTWPISVSGNAATATSATSATSAATWTTARTLTIGNTGKSVNGGANVSWSLAEIGALGATAKAADSELLDGLDSSSFLRSDAADTATGEILFDAGFKSDAILLNGAQNFDNISRSGFYNLYNTNTGSTNSPGFPYGTMVVVGSNKDGATFGFQLAHERLNTAGGLRVRGMNDTGTTWSSWATVWTSQDFANNSANWNTAYGWGNHASAGYAPLASPALTGTPTAPTATAGTNTTQIATTAFVQTAVSNLIDAAPATLDTLNELAAALGDDPNFATTVTTSIGTKVPLTRTLTINGTAYDLSADRTWTISTITGNAGSATVLQTARTFTIGSTGKTFNGSANVSWSLAEIGALGASDTAVDSNKLGGLAASSYYLASNPSGYITASSSITGTSAGVLRTVTGTNSAELVRGNMGDNDQARILVGATASNAGYLEIATADDGTEPIYVRQYTGVFSTLTRTATLLDGSGNTSFPGTLTASNFSGSSSGTNTGDQTTITGNAGSATVLQTARTINGTSFNGSANITTANWGTARTITIGSTGKSVNGSADISWSLAEIGAQPAGSYAAASHTHSYTEVTDIRRIFNNFGNNHTTYQSFDSIADFGPFFIQNTAAGPGTGSSQFYGLALGLGNDYAYGSYALQVAIPRYGSSDKYLSFRTRENGSWQSWTKFSAGYADTAGSASSATTATTATSAATWTTARTLTIGNTGKSVNGSANVSWSIAEIGALALTGGALTGNTSLTTGTSLLFSGLADTNWRIGRNIVTESGNNLTSNTLQFIAAAAAGQGWQFVGSTGITRFELDAFNGNAWFNGGNVAIGVSSASYKLDVGGEIRASSSSNLVQYIKSTSSFGAAISYEDPSSGGNDAIYAGALGSSFFVATGYSRRFIIDSNGNTYPQEDRLQDLGLESNRWRTVYCETLDSAGLHESNLADDSISKYNTGVVLVWQNGKMVPCSKFADHMRMGIAVKGNSSPLVQGAEPVLCTGEVTEGQYLVTSETIGHAVGVDRSYVVEHQLFDCVIGKALESGSGDSFIVKTWVNI